MLYSRRLVRSPVIEPGKGGAYLALFSEIGLIILVTTLGGSLVGYWVDKQLGTVPIFVVVGLLIGLAVGATGVYRLINRFLTRLQ
jgi:ATP synthase protein I